MKEKPILFTGAMVRALLDGSKTQTRRVAKLTDAAHVKESRGHRRWHPADPDAIAACPYGQLGDQLWVRETFAQGWPLGSNGIVEQFDDEGNEKPQKTFYRATSPDLEWCDGGDDCPVAVPWKPSIHMPRFASRITLEVTDVRVERLKDISEADALAEGIVHEVRDPGLGRGGRPGYRWAANQYAGTAVHGYELLWESINGPGSWDANPWVWAVDFKVLKP